MAKWEMLTRPKDQGGLGIIDTWVMNECLLINGSGRSPKVQMPCGIGSLKLNT